MDYLRHIPTFAEVYRRARLWYAAASHKERFAAQFVGTAALVYLAYFIWFAPPWGFPTGAYITLQKGSSLTAMAGELERQGIVTNAWLLKSTARVLGDQHKVPAGVYYFGQPENLVQVAIRLVAGDYDTTPIRVTIPEGSTVAHISKVLLEEIPDFDRRAFLDAARNKEGYLFPDTYFFMPGDDVDSILSVFSNSFHTRINKVQAQITAYGKPLNEVLTMASILEKEASDAESRKIIAGILWNRIKIGMPLQVDATFPYYLGRNTFQVTLDDLRTDHPYNTYTNKGLPPGPIGNPGLSSIVAAVTPTKSNYIFFLSDLDGNFHYCATYECHLANKRKYLD